MKFRLPKFFFGNLGSKMQILLFCLKNAVHSISRLLIPNQDCNIWNSDPKIHFWANLGLKIQNCLFCLEIVLHSTLMILIPNRDLKFRNSNPKSIFGKVYAQKFKVVCFVCKLVNIVSKGCWFRIQSYIFEIPTSKSIFGLI